MKMNNRKKYKLATKILFCASLCASLFPVQAKADLAEDIVAALSAAGADATEIAAVTWSQAKSAVGAVYGEGKEWGADAFQDILQISQQYGVQIDALVPSIQGCIKEADGTPLVGVNVVGVGALPGTWGSLVPVVATTSGTGIPATVFGLPVQEAWLSVSQGENWGPGCYWMPAPPGLADGGVSVITQESTIVHKVIPFAPGYEMFPPGKEITMLAGAQSVAVKDLDNPFSGSLSDTPVTVD